MATGNRHKTTVGKVKVPSPPSVIEWGPEGCCDAFLVLADTINGERYYNDVTLAVEKLYNGDDTADFVLEYNGADVSPMGLSIVFPNEAFVSAFVIDWRQHLAANGPGCYRLRVDYDVNGLQGSYYKASYNLKPWSVVNALGTVRIFSVYNDLSRKYQINFTDSGAVDTLRFNGMFGLMQPNYTIQNLTSVGYIKRKVENEDTKTYELEMDYTSSCYTGKLIDEHLLHANEMYISDHNDKNHRWDYIDWPVILKKDSTPSFTYQEGSRLASVKATFEDKVQIDESQFAGGLASGTNASYELVGSGTTVALPIHIHNSNDTFEVDEYPPVYELPDTVIDIYVYGVLNQSVTVPTLDPTVVINIS